MMEISAILEGTNDFLFEVEGCVLKPYKDSGGVWTCGVGFTYYKGKPVTEHYPADLTLDNCHIQLNSNINFILEDIQELIGSDIKLNDNQYVALCSFVYNIGISAFKQSTMLKLINENDLTKASQQFPLWNHVNGAVCDGLTNRRRKEQQLFDGEITL
ncbi:lysozyme [Gluconobacter frateurii]|uniref:Lysozyme n=2 Tax=Gluconobacter frateurii TaxID=38308 RepID=A0ABQ0QDA9_9PROT|nr:phage-related lysozyme [Gluconobacter frateurii NRIC 0228]GLP92003.1 lysozyme [Gluconobacter frateurii]